MTKISPTVRGISFLVLSLLIGSIQGIAVKWLGGSYPVLEMVVLRSLVALPFTLLFFWYEGRRGLPTTKHFKLEMIRGLFLFVSYTTFMMGLSAMPLAEVESIRFSGPIVITLLSVLMLSERVELSRWLALIVGFMGVLLIVRPGSTSFNIGSIFVLLGVLFYALTIVFTRMLQDADSSATMAYYSSLVYLFAGLAMVPFTLMVGELPDAHPSIAFLFHHWSMPTLLDGIIMGGLGLVWAGWTYCMVRAYSLAQASVIAPFEYVSLPINIVWGFIFWHEIPTWLTMIGATLTLLSGMFIMYRERITAKVAASRRLEESA